MDEYVNRKDLRDTLYDADAITMDGVKIINQFPLADVAPVIWCENCQFWDNEHISSEGLAKCVTGESGIRYRGSHDFCSRGLRKEVHE